MNKLIVIKDEDKDEEYKEDNSEAPESDESVIKQTKLEKALTYCLMSIHFPIKLIQYEICTISSCRQNMI